MAANMGASSPRYMEFPFKAYSKGGAGRLSDNTARIKSLFS